MKSVACITSVFLTLPRASLPELNFFKKEPLSHVTASNEFHSGEAIEISAGGDSDGAHNETMPTLRGAVMASVLQSADIEEAEEELECDYNDVDLSSYQQWKDETGYWVGQYDFYQENGTPHESKAWNYPFHSYKGFIAGNALGTKYRQRNVFLYRPQDEAKCLENSSVWGDGTCGVNGNVKLFAADQVATTCSTNPALAGDISGDYGDHFFTTTELIGQQADNAVLYQVWLKAGAFGLSDQALLFQSQLTTITRGVNADEVYRTRSAQEFEVFDATKRGRPLRVSFYRERKVEKEEFYHSMAEAMKEFNILPSDVCSWQNGPVGNVIPSGHDPEFSSCVSHLEESFEI